jgi:hypothetical protein
MGVREFLNHVRVDATLAHSWQSREPQCQKWQSVFTVLWLAGCHSLPLSSPFTPQARLIYAIFIGPCCASILSDTAWCCVYMCYYIHHGSQRRNSRSQDGVYPEPYMVPLPFDRDAFTVPVSDAIRGAKDVLKQHGSQGSGNRFRSSSPAWSANRDCLSACTRPAKQPIRPPAPAARFPAFDSDNNSKTKLLCIGASSLLAAVKSTDESG